MSFRFLTLGFLVALAGAGASLRAQAFEVTVGEWTFGDVGALSVFNPVSTSGSFSRPWRGDQVLETLAVESTPVDLTIGQRFTSGILLDIPAADLTQWELTAEDGLFATETVVFSGRPRADTTTVF
jgi:hypothetical protein